MTFSSSVCAVPMHSKLKSFSRMANCFIRVESTVNRARERSAKLVDNFLRVLSHILSRYHSKIYSI